MTDRRRFLLHWIPGIASTATFAASGVTPVRSGMVKLPLSEHPDFQKKLDCFDGFSMAEIWDGEKLSGENCPENFRGMTSFFANQDFIFREV